MAPPESDVVKVEREKQDQHNRKVRRIQDIQLGPVKSLPMMMFMMWMTGNDIHIFSIMMTGMAIYQPIQSLGQVGAIFKMFADDPALKGDVLRGKLIYAACCLAALCVGLAKLHWMGLLPTAAADWVDHNPPLYGEVTSTHIVS